MAWQPPLWLGGPILEWELLRANRRPWAFLFRNVYAAWLGVQLFFMTVSFYGQVHVLRMGRNGVYGREIGDPIPPANVGEMEQHFAEGYLTLLAFQQLIILMLVTPAMVAGALGAEKEKGTLALLFSTDLSAFEIILGKLVGRLLILGQVLLLGLPLLLVVGILAEAPLGRLLLIELQAGIVTLAVAATGLLVSVLSRSTREAILGCYAALVLVYIGLGMLLGGSLPMWIEPFTALERLTSTPYDRSPGAAGGQVVSWACAAIVCLIATFLWLRPIGVRQLEGVRGQRFRLLWTFRPPIGDHPIRWREQHIIGLAPLPHLRFVPGWLAKLGVFGFALIMAFTALMNLNRGIWYRFTAGDFAGVWDSLQRLDTERLVSEVIIMGVVLLIIGTIVVAVRSTTCVSEERRRKTWDDIVMTPLDWEEIRWEKMWGILRATHVYLLLYALPMFALAALGNEAALLWAGLLAGGSWLAMLVVAVMGTEYSMGTGVL